MLNSHSVVALATSNPRKVVICDTFNGMIKGWLNTRIRHADVCADQEVIRHLLMMGSKLPGKVVQTDYLENDLPEFFTRNKEKYVMKNGNTFFLKNSQKIFRTFSYDPSGLKEDVTIIRDMKVTVTLKPVIYGEYTIVGAKSGEKCAFEYYGPKYIIKESTRFAK